MKALALVRKAGRLTLGFVKSKFWWLLIIALILFVVWRWQLRQASLKTPEVFEHPVRQDLTKYLEISGIIDAKEKASLRFAAGGKVVYLGAQEGDWIKKGQTLATIDQADLNKRLQQDLNNYMKERWDWDQQLDDIKDRTIDKREQRSVDQNQWDLENEVLDVEIRDIAIRNTVLSSPIEGVLIESPTNVKGVQLLATDSFEVINPGSLIFKALVDEAEIAQVMASQSAYITLDAYPDETVDSFVKFISYKSTETSSGTSFIIEMPFPNNSSLEKYRLGMNGDAQILVTSKSNVLTVPIDAIRQRDNKNYVDVRTNGESFAEREIEIGLETDDFVEVTAGLSESDEVRIPQ
ncbi:MAG: efflux RND transporter periplasmic adaptor subunit [Patescibacteria group bacterium]